MSFVLAHSPAYNDGWTLHKISVGVLWYLVSKTLVGGYLNSVNYNVMPHLSKICLSSTSYRLRSGKFEDRVNFLNSLSFSLNHSWAFVCMAWHISFYFGCKHCICQKVDNKEKVHCFLSGWLSSLRCQTQGLSLPLVQGFWFPNEGMGSNPTSDISFVVFFHLNVMWFVSNSATMFMQVVCVKVPST